TFRPPPTFSHRSPTDIHPLMTALLLLSLLQPSARPLVRAGEELTYVVSSQRFGSMGKAIFGARQMTVDGHEALELSFDFSARVVLFKVSDRTRSYLCPETMGMFRYTKSEKSPIGGHNEDVTADPSKGMLDELSFIYLVRGLDIEPGQTMEIRRHFDEARNPVL